MSDTKTLVTPQELAEELGIPVSTLSAWRYVGKGPRFLKLGKHCRYRRADIDAWLTDQLAPAK